MDSRQTRRIAVCSSAASAPGLRGRKTVHKALKSAHSRRSRSRRAVASAEPASDLLLSESIRYLSRLDHRNARTLTATHRILEEGVKPSGALLRHNYLIDNQKNAIRQSHIWCTLLLPSDDSTLNTEEASDLLPEMSTSADTASIKAQVYKALSPIREVTLSLSAELSPDEIHQALRVAALFICPAPERHHRLRAESFLPLARQATSDVRDPEIEFAITCVESSLTDV
ncbi:hypothetical protein [Pseudoclavibacter sp. 13-3]|uniref:hypothetical protein n=1 Tax=Pseudoclavibacter sp. 13-3 TaxID=2901228 RepID=UPI001E54F5F6|nr:hypothetical protein [Pseudoclavibacter sp. 13-3]MCD7100729.1 hypothetical protein [Pseudoclavibacter sp. 13-3]